MQNENERLQNEDSKEKKNLSHPDKDLGPDYRPTRHGSTDADRKRVEQGKGEEKKH
jgi:hypothetical protein